MRWKLLFLLVIIFYSYAQKVSTPYEAVYNHLYYLQPENFKPDSAVKSLYPYEDISYEELKKRAIQLKYIYDGLGFYVNMDAIPNNPDYRDTTSGNYIYYINKRLLPQVYLKKYGDKWLYSKTTIQQIPKIYKEVYPFGISKIVDYFSVHRNFSKFLGLYVWQWVGLLFLIVISLILFYINKYVVRRIIRIVLRFSKKTLVQLPVPAIIKLSKAISYLVVVFFIKLAFRALLLPIVINQFVISTLDIISLILGILIVQRVVGLIIALLEQAARRTQTKLDDQILPMLKSVSFWGIWILGILFILQNLGYNIYTLLAGLSIGGIAVALAAQDTLKNFFGSIMIFLDRPFTVGDWIITSSVEGIVESVGLRATRIRTFANSLVYLPNALLMEQPIDNMGMRQFRRYKTLIGVEYSTSRKQIQEFVNKLREFAKEHPKIVEKKSVITFYSFGDSSLNILFYIFINAPTWSEELQIRQEINLKIMELAEELNINFAFPSQSLYIEKLPEKFYDNRNR